MLSPPVFVPSQVDVLYDGAYEHAMEDVAAKARRELRLDYFVFAGPAGDRLAGRLIARQAAGVRVRVIFDAAMLPVPELQRQQRAIAARLRAGGIEVRDQDRRPLPPRVGGATMDHNKYMVADQDAAVVGSANLGAPFYSFHDLMLKVRGPVVKALAEQFDYDWEVAGHPERPLAGALVHAEEGHPAPGTARIVGTGPGRKTGLEAVLGVLSIARTSVYMQAYELQDPRILAALSAARDRGVDVRVLLDPGDVDQFTPFGWAPRGILNAAGLRRMLDARVPTRVYRPAGLVRTAHMKLLVVDGERLIAGSINFSRGGLEWAYETDLEIFGGRAPGQAVAHFLVDWDQQADPSPGPGWVARALCAYYNWNDGNVYPPGPAWLVPPRK
ncbi:MAG: phospholipase D/Transphosphatidylase [Cyanobacteria bacterium RYN_339]|nr:phospholipase D/Transphosphatidylase [Cyanobacteria bacterium RYN_339]